MKFIFKKLLCFMVILQPYLNSCSSQKETKHEVTLYSIRLITSDGPSWTSANPAHFKEIIEKKLIFLNSAYNHPNLSEKNKNKIDDLRKKFEALNIITFEEGTYFIPADQIQQWTKDHDQKLSPLNTDLDRTIKDFTRYGLLKSTPIDDAD
jgi:hypothetical protein